MVLVFCEIFTMMKENKNKHEESYDLRIKKFVNGNFFFKIYGQNYVLIFKLFPNAVSFRVNQIHLSATLLEPKFEAIILVRLP